VTAVASGPDAAQVQGALTWPALLGRLLGGTDLGADDTAWVMDRVLSGEATAAQLAGFLVALRAKGEAPAEVAGLASAMLAHARRVTVARPAVDVVGTGGDQAHTVNISTMAAVVVAAAGVPVVKHGNRAASSASGAADVLEALGVAIDLPPDGVAASVEQVGIGFCFAPVFHPAMRHTGPVRRELGVPTAMNVLGPLTNPAQPPAALVGCADARLAPVLAEVLAGRGSSALVVRGDDGLDELTTTTTSRAWGGGNGAVRRVRGDAAALGVPVATRDDLRGGDAAVNAAVFRRLLAGEAGPVRDAVLLNAAAALVAFDGVSAGPPADLGEALSVAMGRAAQAVDSGAAEALLARWAELSTRLRGASS
jgi:anthranilate phosphoribosyltransferase